VLAPVAQSEVGVAASWVGVVTALVFVSATWAAIVSGGPIERYGALRVSQASLLLCGTGVLLMASASPWLIVLGALVVGFGYGQVTPSSSVILNERAPSHLRAFIFSLKQTGVPVGGALAGALLPGLTLLAGWRAAVFIASATCLFLAIVLQPWRASLDIAVKRDVPVRRSSWRSIRLVLAHRPLRELGLASFTYSGMQNCLGSFLVVYLHDRIGFGLGAAGFALSLAMFAGIVGRLAWGIVADRFIEPRRLLALLGLSMSFAAFLTAAVSSSWPMIAVFLTALAFGITAVGWNGVYLSEVAHLTSSGDASAATGAALALTYAGIVVMPLLFWSIVRVSDSYAAAYCVAGCLTLWRSLLLWHRTSAPKPT
jgi:MFS family permease